MADNIYLSPIKREKLKKEQKRQTQEKLRAELPVLTHKQIRSYRLPHHEALLADLSETDYRKTLDFLTHLIENQDVFTEKYQDGADKSKLSESKEVLNQLSECLINAEKAEKSRHPHKQFDEMVNLSVSFAFQNTNQWWWLGEQILYKTLEIAIGNEHDEAIVRFLLGKFHFENCDNKKSAKGYLEKTRQISAKQDWKVPKSLEIPFCGTISCQTACLLYKILLIEADEEEDLIKSLEMTILAKKLASEACDRMGEYQSLMSRGYKELHLNETVKAISSYTKALNLAKRTNYLEGVCLARLKIALSYLIHGRKERALEELHILKDYAVLHQLPYYRAEALAYIGEFYLKRNDARLSIPYLKVAYELFNKEEEKYFRREQVADLTGIAIGEELFCRYQDMVLKADHINNHFFQLLDWMDSRERFWEGPSGYDIDYTQALTEIGEDENEILSDPDF